MSGYNPPFNFSGGSQLFPEYEQQQQQQTSTSPYPEQTQLLGNLYSQQGYTMQHGQQLQQYSMDKPQMLATDLQVKLPPLQEQQQQQQQQHQMLLLQHQQEQEHQKQQKSMKTNDQVLQQYMSPLNKSRMDQQQQLMMDNNTINISNNSFRIQPSTTYNDKIRDGIQMPMNTIMEQSSVKMDNVKNKSHRNNNNTAIDMSKTNSINIEQGSELKKNRIRKACDTCHLKRVKCSGGEPCANCKMLDTKCTYNRDEKRRGRASDKYPKEIKKRKQNVGNNSMKKSNSSTSTTVNGDEISILESKKIPVVRGITIDIAATPERTVIEGLPSNNTHDIKPNINGSFHNKVLQNNQTSSYPIVQTVSKELKELGIPMDVADKLFEYYFIHNPSGKLFNIVKPSRMMNSSRVTKKSLVLTVLLTSALEISDCEFFISLSNRDSTNRSLYHKIQELMPSHQRNFQLDDLITLLHLAYFMPWLSYSHDSVYWWNLSAEIGAMLELDKLEKITRDENKLIMDQVAMEEHRRALWALYVLDRLIPVAFNQKTKLKDEFFKDVKLPCSESLFIQPGDDILTNHETHDGYFFRDLWSDEMDPGLRFDGVPGWIVPICKIMGLFIEMKEQYSNVQVRDLLKAKITKFREKNLKTIEMIETNSPIVDVEVQYAKYLNLVLGIVADFDPNVDNTLGIMSNRCTTIAPDIETCSNSSNYSNHQEGEPTINERQLNETIDKLTTCITVLERITALDMDLSRFPVILSFYLFVVGVSVLSTLNDIKSRSISKIPTFKYFIKTLIRVFESCMISFPGEFLKTVRNQLIWCIKDCDNLILLNDYYSEFKVNSQRRIDSLKAFNWNNGGQGIGI